MKILKLKLFILAAIFAPSLCTGNPEVASTTSNLDDIILLKFGSIYKTYKHLTPDDKKIIVKMGFKYVEEFNRLLEPKKTLSKKLEKEIEKLKTALAKIEPKLLRLSSSISLHQKMCLTDLAAIAADFYLNCYKNLSLKDKFDLNQIFEEAKTKTEQYYEATHKEFIRYIQKIYFLENSKIANKLNN